MGKATFYAFISHKSTDAKFAQKLQKFIESYNLPAAVRQMTGFPGKRLTPLCSYEVDFSSNPLLDEMQDKLNRSHYLILLCSEELMKSDPRYIDYEIRTFIACKKAAGIDPLSRIIPIILSGEFGSAEHECCPEALRELGENCPIALDRKKYKNERELFLHVISSLLRIDYAVLENRDKKRQRTKKLIWGTGLALLLTAGVLLGEYFIPKQEHYVDFVMKNGLPEGIGPVSTDVYEKMTGHYVVTRQKHKIQSLEYVNAYGNRINHGENVYDGDRPSAYLFSYTDEGLSAVTYEDKFGNPYFILQYSGNSLSSVDLRNPYDSGEAFYIGSGYESDPTMLLADENWDAHSDISRFRYEYSPDGFVNKVFFCADSTGRLAQDNSVYGFEYALDEKGRVIETYFLDGLGHRRLNSQGVYCRKFAYDAQDNLAEFMNFGRNGEPVADGDGIVCCEFFYDENHNFLGYSFFDGNGNPMFVASYGGAQQKQYVNDRGNLTRVELLNEQGELCTDLEYCAMAFTYDEMGYTASRTYLDAEGQPVLSPSQNYAEIRYVNDEKGNPVESTFHDAQGNLINNAHGYAKEVTQYNAMGLETCNTYFDAEGQPVDYRGYGYSSQKTDYDQRGREISIAYFDQDGQPVNTLGPIFGFGYHRLETVYEYGAHTKQIQTFYGTDGQPVNLCSSSMGEEYSRSELIIQNGEITYMATYRADGSIFGSIMESETTRSAQAEPIKTVRYKDGQDNILKESVSQYRLNGIDKAHADTVYDENGNVVTNREVSYHENGQRMTDRTLEYNADGSLFTEYTQTFDETGKVVKEVLTEPANTENPTYIVDSYYDEAGILAEEIHTSLDAAGNILSLSSQTFCPDGTRDTTDTTWFDGNGTAALRNVTVYNQGVKVSVTDYEYNTQGNPDTVTETQYRSDGSKASRKYLFYRENGLLEICAEYLYNEDGTAKQTISLYDEAGQLQETITQLLDENGNAIE